MSRTPCPARRDHRTYHDSASAEEQGRRVRAGRVGKDEVGRGWACMDAHLEDQGYGRGRGGKGRVGVNGDSAVSFLKTWRIKEETLKSRYLKIIEGAGDAQPPGPPKGPPAGGTRSRGHKSDAPPELGALKQRQRPVTVLGEDAGSARHRAPPGETERRGGLRGVQVDLMVRESPQPKTQSWKRSPGAPSARWATSSYASRGRPQPQPHVHGQGQNTSTCQGKLKQVAEVISNID